nr:putative extracellular glycosidase [Quercus suber]
MLSLIDVLAMSSPLRLATIATIAGILFAQPTIQQTYTSCNPTSQSGCTPNTALGTSLNVDFSSASDDFTAQGAPTYGSDGASFTVAQSGNAPTLTSKWYIMFGRYEVVMKAAPGAGIVSSAVLQSDDLDEIDWEWLGAESGQVQSNYFGKGQTTTYDRAAVHAVSNSQSDFHTYAIEWTEDQIVWSIDGTTVRVLSSSDANGQYPQTPMQLKLGAWSGGDPSNSPGTIQWAEGPTDYSQGPFTMVVKSLSVVDFSTGTAYTYGDQSGAWTSIESTGGAVNGNSGAASGTSAAAPVITSTSSGSVEPFSGTHAECSTCTTPGLGTWTISTVSEATATETTYPGLPAGWTVSGSGKVVPPSAAPLTSPLASSTLSPVVSPAASCSGLSYSTVTSYDEQGFLTTAIVPVGVSTGWDEQGFATTIFPSGCGPAATVTAAKALLAKADALATITSSGLLTLPSAAATVVASANTPTSGTNGHRSVQWASAACTVLLSLIWFL